MIKIKLTILSTLFTFLLFNISSGSDLSTPESTVIGYIEAYKKLDWSEAVNYLHPQMLNNLKNQIINILKSVKETDLDEVLALLGDKTISELEQMPAEQFYIINQERWIKDKSINIALYKVIKSAQIRENEYLIEISYTVLSDKPIEEKFLRYYVKLHENKWKIYYILRL